MKRKEEKFSDLLKTTRFKLKKNQSEMAELLGMKLRMYSDYETGKYDNSEGDARREKYLQTLAKINKEPERIPTLTKPDKSIPFYDIDISASDIEMFNDKPEIPSLQIHIPGFEDCDFAVPVFGHSAYPTYENGVIVICKRIKDIELIAFGEYHLIITPEQRLLKRVLKSEHKDRILAVSDNQETRNGGKRVYDNFEIAKSKIKQLYLVKGCIKRNQL